MIARVLISPDLEIRKEEINKSSPLQLNHPDLLYFPSDSKLGVAQAKEIREFFSIKPYQAKGRVVVMEDAGKLTMEAQNALLKTLEEPPEEAILILGADSETNFLPTILSRCEIVTIRGTDLVARGLTTDEVYTKDIANLLTQDIAERFEYIEKLKDQKKREAFLKALTVYFHQDLRSYSSGGNTDFLRELLQAEEWAETNVNIRGILEYLMLKMPSRNP